MKSKSEKSMNLFVGLGFDMFKYCHCSTRKVNHDALEMSALLCMVNRDLLQCVSYGTPKITSELDINEPIKVFSGVMAGDGSLVRIEEYVAFSHDEYDKVYYSS